MNAEIELDKWDYQLILTFKRYSDLCCLTRVKELWGKRNGVKPEYIRFIDIVHELEKIRSFIWTVNKATHHSVFNILLDNSPYKENIYYEDYKPMLDMMGADERYWARLVLAYGSMVRFIDSKDLPPDFNEYFINVWIKEGNP